MMAGTSSAADGSSSNNKATDVGAAGGNQAGSGTGGTELVSLRKLRDAVENWKPDAASRDVMEDLKNAQVEHIRLEEEYRREWNELKLKYLQKFRPLYKRRLNILQGQGGEGGTPALPGFWVTAMKNHVLLHEMVEPHDVPVLNNLRDVVFEWLDDREQSSFCLKFYFRPNEHFTNEVLVKTYHLEPSDEDDEESVLTRTEGTTINWCTGKNVTEKIITRKQRNKRTNQIRTVREVVEENSFFNIFQTHIVPGTEALEAMEEREITELEMIVEAEFEVGCIFRDKIIPRALGWYLGIERDNDVDTDAVSQAGRNDEGGFDDEDVDGSDDDDEDDDDDDDDDDPAAAHDS